MAGGVFADRRITETTSNRSKGENEDEDDDFFDSFCHDNVEDDSRYDSPNIDEQLDEPPPTPLRVPPSISHTVAVTRDKLQDCRDRLPSHKPLAALVRRSLQAVPLGSCHSSRDFAFWASPRLASLINHPSIQILPQSRFRQPLVVPCSKFHDRMTGLSGNRLVLHCPLQVLDMRNPTGPRLTLPFPVEGAEAVAELRRNRLAAVSPDEHSVFDLGTGLKLQSLPGFPALGRTRRFCKQVLCVASSDGHLVVAVSGPSTGKFNTLVPTTLSVFAEEPDGKVGSSPPRVFPSLFVVGNACNVVRGIPFRLLTYAHS